MPNMMGRLTVTKFNDLLLSRILFVTIFIHLPLLTNAHSAYSLQRYSEFPPLPERTSSNSQFFSHPFNRVIKEEQKRKFLSQEGSSLFRHNQERRLKDQQLQQNEQLKSRPNDVLCFPSTDNSAAVLNDQSVYVYYAVGQMFLCKLVDKYTDQKMTTADRYNKYHNKHLNKLYGSDADLFMTRYDSPNNVLLQENKVPVKKRTEYDFIRFGRSDPLLANPNQEHFQHQQKKQEDKKASGTTYDYIRFGKRSPNYSVI